MPVRTEFPEAGNPSYLGGESDGYVYRISFRGSTLQKTYDLVRAFLEEEGYGDVPVPADAEQLKLFQLPTRHRQLSIFEEAGYVHNPVKILFPVKPRFKNTLIVCLHHEADPDHLLKFHGVKRGDRE